MGRASASSTEVMVSRLREAVTVASCSVLPSAFGGWQPCSSSSSSSSPSSSYYYSSSSSESESLFSFSASPSCSSKLFSVIQLSLLGRLPFTNLMKRMYPMTPATATEPMTMSAMAQPGRVSPEAATSSLKGMSSLWQSFLALRTAFCVLLMPSSVLMISFSWTLSQRILFSLLWSASRPILRKGSVAFLVKVKFQSKVILPLGKVYPPRMYSTGMLVSPQVSGGTSSCWPVSALKVQCSQVSQTVSTDLLYQSKTSSMRGRRWPMAKYPSNALMQFSLSQKPQRQKILAISWVATVPVLSMWRLSWKEWKLLVTTMTSVCQYPNLLSQYSLLTATAVKKAALGSGRWMRTSSSFRLINSTFRISTDLRPRVHRKSTTNSPFRSSVITSRQVPEMLVKEKCALPMKQGPPTQSLAAVRSSVLMYSISSKISGSKGSWLMAQMSTPPSRSKAHGFSSTSTTIMSSSMTCMLVTCCAVEQQGPLTKGLEAVQKVVQRQTSLLFLQAESEKSQTQWCSMEMQFSPSSTEGSETNCSIDPLWRILMIDWNCWMKPPSKEKAQSSMSCTPSSSRSSFTWFTTFILPLHSSQLSSVQLITDPLSQVESSKTFSCVKLLLQSNWLVRQSVWLRRVSLTQMSSGQLAIFTLDLERQLNRACGSLVQVRLNEQSLKESSKTKIGTSYCLNMVSMEPQQTVTQSPKLPVASMSISSYFMLSWKTSQREETAGRRVRQTRMTVLVLLGSFGSIAWMQTRLPLSEKSKSNLSGITQPKVGKTLFIGASPRVQISSRSCSSMRLGGFTRISSPLAIAIFHLQNPGSWVAGDLISASLMGPVLVIWRMTTRSMHCTKSTPGWKSEVQTSMGEKQLTPMRVMVRESMRQSSLHSLSWWSQHSTMSKKAISLTYRSTTTRYCPTNSIDWILPSYPSGNMMGLAPSSALRSTSQTNTSLGRAQQRMAARWMYCPSQQWKRLAVRLAMRKLMCGAYPASMQWTSSVKGTVMQRLKWVSLLQSCVQMQICVSSMESYCSCRRKEYLKMLGSLFHQFMRVEFCCSTKDTGGSLSQLSNTPQVMFDPSTYLSSGMNSCPGQLAQQVSGSFSPVGQSASESLATTMYLKVKVQTSDSLVYSLVLSPLTMKLNSLLRRVGFCGKTLTTGVESWQRMMLSVSMVTSCALSRFMSTKAWKLGCGKAAQALRQVRLPRVKTQVDWYATVMFLASVRLAVIWATTYWSFTQRSCIQAPSGTEYLVMMTGLIWLVQSSSMMAWSWASTSRNSLTMLLEYTPRRVNPESVRYLPTMMMVCAVEMSNLMTPLWQSRMQMSPRQTSKSMMESLS